jgi:predicted PurR-regulated permease PerM
MTQVDPTKQTSSKPAQFSYLFMLGAFILVGWLHLATPLIVTLFGYLALTKLHFLKRRGKWVAVAFFLVLVCGAAYGLGYFVHQTVPVLPEIADKAIPSVIQLAKEYRIELPFTDYDSLKDVALDTVRSQANYLASIARLARGATTQLLFLIVGIVVAISLFLRPQFELDGDEGRGGRDNLYVVCCGEIAARFRTLYLSFVAVMGAQVIISAINTILTAVFVAVVGLPYAVVVIGATFLCGLLPVVGNLISNTIVVGIGFTLSPRLALTALVFLVVIHKLEYFLNSKIVGWRIRNPFWLTLLALVVGERLIGLPGMILAPVLLSYIRDEASRIRSSPLARSASDASPSGPQSVS